jgi:hypothetical protein
VIAVLLASSRVARRRLDVALGSRQIHTSTYAGGMASESIRRISSLSTSRLPSGRR